MSVELRFEAKYLLDPHSYHRVHSSFRAYCAPDGFSRSARDGRYLVRSLYFDTWDYEAYVAKITGEAERKKLRIRTYFPSRASLDFLNVEIKRRFGRFIQKQTKRISLQRFDEFMRTFRWADEEDPILEEFQRDINIRALRPTVVVEYRREALAARDGSNVRVCFDYNPRYARSGNLFCLDSQYHRDLSPSILLEIKTPKDDIGWLNRLVREHDLGVSPNSKYVNAINHSQATIWY